MGNDDLKQGLAAIVSADVTDYSRLLSQDRVGTIRALNDHREMISSFIQQYGGRVVDMPGDNILAVIDSASDAVNCAVEIQRELAERNAEVPSARMMQWRIGVNLGDIVEEDGKVYGDGVNIAARVEGLAEPGGICVSGRVYDQVHGKLGLEYESLGEKTVKNIANPIRIYRVLSYPGAAAHRVVKAKGDVTERWHKVTLAVVTVAVLCVGCLLVWTYTRQSRTATLDAVKRDMERAPTKQPSIAVLPFENLSGDPQQGYFSDGITEEIITRLSPLSWLTVIARNSTFYYKGKQVRIRQIGEELGVDYVVEGSVRKTANVIRVTTQLIDAKSEGHLWAKTYERQLQDIFTLEDEIAHQIATMLGGEALVAEQARVRRIPTENLTAYDSVVRGYEYYLKATKEANNRAKELYHKAIELDPQYALAHVCLALSYWSDYALRWDPDPQILEEAYQLGKKALDLGEETARYVLARVYAKRGEVERAISEAERLLDIDPNNAEAHYLLGELLVNDVGRPEDAIPRLKKAIRLNPKHGGNYLMLARAYRYIGRREDAIAESERAVFLSPDWAEACREAAWCYLELWQNQLDKDHRLLSKAMQMAQRGKALDEDSTWGHSLLSSIYVAEEQYDLSIAEAEKMIVLAPSAGEGYVTLADAYRAAGKHVDAIEALEEGLAKNPGNRPIHSAMISTYTDLWYMQHGDGSHFLGKGRDMAVRLSDLGWDTRWWIGFFHLQQNQYQQSMEKAEELIQELPDESGNYVLMAMINNSLGKPEKAIGMVERALQLDAERTIPAWYLTTLGNAYWLSGLQADALRVYHEALGRYHRSVDAYSAHLGLAIVYAELDRMDEAEASAAEVVGLVPHFSVDVWGERIPYKDPAQAERDMAALRKAGLK